MLVPSAAQGAIAARQRVKTPICLLLVLYSASVGNALIQPCITPSKRGLSLRSSLLICGVGKAEGPYVFGRPNVSRYEGFYKNSGSEAIEAEAKVVDSHSEQITNPFYVGYEMEELAMLWDVHTANYGERTTDNDIEKNISNEPMKIAGDNNVGFEIDALPLPLKPVKMGLHELILEACREADEENSRPPE